MSVVAAFVCVLAVPLIYNYVQHVQTLLQNEVDYCKVSTSFLFLDVFAPHSSSYIVNEEYPFLLR